AAPTPPAPVPVSPTFAPPAPETFVFTPSSADIPNPERGFYKWFSKQSLSGYAENGYTLAYTTAGKLTAYRERDLPPEYLNALAVRFQLARDAGIKLILRFSYNDGPSAPNTEPDAPLAQVLRHIEQLAPVLEANKDVIVWFEAGFIGAWGEWHSSTNGLDSDENKAIIRDALLAHFPQDRFILFRYPGDFIGWYPQPLTEAQAFSGTNQARTGHHNDCFLASDSDFGTYYDRKNGVLRDVEWKAYIAQMTRFVPMSGETCNPNPPRSDCETTLQEMELLHWSALNEAYHPDVIQGWKDQGCYAEIRNRLGYRLTLLEAATSPTVQQGSELQVEVKLENTGFASPLLVRPVYLVLVNSSGESAYEQVIFVDLRRWEAGLHTFAATLTLPVDFPAGEYQLALWLPDPSTTLRDDPRYAIRFANENTWDAEHGWNVLGSVIIRE
ncbi:MAG: DUF4832 domain-containing protein, partial [Anaerolineales bacterium]|nr:DUF4832 domain-containing protein [Anaerolineales bacterium]